MTKVIIIDDEPLARMIVRIAVLRIGGEGMAPLNHQIEKGESPCRRGYQQGLPASVSQG